MTNIFSKNLIGIAALLAIIGFLNYQGVGVACARYYTDEEKSEIAVKYVFDEYSQYSKLSNLGYENHQEYIKLVKNCCVVGFGWMNGGPGPLYRLTGQLADYVLIPAVPKERIIGKPDDRIQDVIKSLRDNEHFYVAVTYCGEAWDPLD